MDRPGTESYHVDLTLRAHKVDGQWAAYCVEFDSHSCGDSLDEAFENAVEATLAYLNTIERLGLRRQVFDERGIDPERGLPHRHAPKDVQVDVGEFVHRFTAARNEGSTVPA